MAVNLWLYLGFISDRYCVIHSSQKKNDHKVGMEVTKAPKEEK